MKAEDYFKRGNVKFRNTDLEGAIADYDKAIELNPRYAIAYFNRGTIMALKVKGDLDGALADFDKSIELNSCLMQTYLKTGKAKVLKGDLDSALADFDKAIALNSCLAEAYFNSGKVKDFKGDLDSALADYDKAIEFKPSHAGAYVNRGIIKSNKDDLDGALADYDKAIELDPNSAEGYNNRGIIKSNKDDLDGALADYDKAIELDPNSAEGYNNRGSVKGHKNDLDGALADYDKAIELKPQYVNAYVNRGKYKVRKGELDGALADYDKAIELKPRYAVAYYFRGTAKSYKGDLDGAFVDYDKANKLDFSNPNFALDLRIAKVTEKLKLPDRKLVLQLRQKVDKLLNAISKQPKNGVEPMHYTNLNTLKNLVEGAKFRLFNSSNMTDSSEGQVFFKLLSSDKKKQESIKQTFGGVYASNVYLGSFVMDSHADVGDDMMWRTYGKHEGKENAGSALVFKKNIFAEKWISLYFHRALLQNDIFESKVKPVLHEELFLFPIFYLNHERNTTEIKGIYRELAVLGSTLSKLQYIECNDTIELICDMLGIVRFLFKNKKYSREQEARLVIWRKDSTGKVVKMEPPGNKYIECPLNLKPYRVILGQNVCKVKEWKNWIETETNNKIEVRKSY